MKPYSSVATALAASSLIFLAACNSSDDTTLDGALADPANPNTGLIEDPIEGQIEDPVENMAEQGLFFNGTHLETRDAGNSALVGFTLQANLLSARALVPDGSFVGETETLTLDCAEQGTMIVSQTLDNAPNAFITTRTHQFDDCRQGESTYNGTLGVSIEEFGIGASEQTTTVSRFDLSIEGVSNGQGSLSMSGDLTTVELTELNTSSACPPADTDRLDINIDQGGTYSDPLLGTSAGYETLSYFRNIADSQLETDAGCTVTEIVRYQAQAIGTFDSIADDAVTISKDGVYSEGAIGDDDTQAVFQVMALESESLLAVTATGTAPMAVQVDIVDMGTVQSFPDTWDFSN